MTLVKKYLKSKPICKVKFELPKANAKDSQQVSLVGDFNQWNEQEGAMKKQRNGNFVLTLDLATGAEYQFRYILDGKHWENDPSADKYVPNNVCGADNSVVVV
jgi:1,4-alpha-glucan branching enzyme